MAGQDSSQEKTEEATPKKLREARKKGQVPKSRDVSTICVLIFLFGVLVATVGYAGVELRKLMELSFSQIATIGSLDFENLWIVGMASGTAFLKILGPFFLVGVVISVLVGFLQVGPIFTTEPLKPQLKKLNALEGIKNWFKTKTFIELFKNILKIFLVFYLAYSTVSGDLYTILQTANIPPENSVGIAAGLIFRFVIKVLIAFLAISIIDFLVQKQQFMKEMKMTKDEVKREYKQDEGDPLIKSHRKHMHREYAFGDVRQAVKQSDVVVTNPTHVAVAVQYDRVSMAAPIISIKGQRAFAELIKQVAEENDIPIMRNVPLAWALFDLEEGTEVPEDLYNVVAEVLAYVYRMKQARDRAVSQGDRKDFL